MTPWILCVAIALAQDAPPADGAATQPAAGTPVEEVDHAGAAPAAETNDVAPEVVVTGEEASPNEGASVAPEDRNVKPEDIGREGDIEVITVWGPFALRQARAEIVRRMRDIGWKPRERLRNDGTTVFRGPEPWMGKALLGEDGSLYFTRPILAFEGVGYNDTEFDHNAGLNNTTQSQAVGADFSMLPEKAKLDAVHASVIDAIRAELGQYQTVVRETHFRDMVDSVAERLDRLWLTGEALDGSDVLYDTPAARRRAALSFWANRADNFEGNVVADAAEAWLVNVVEESEHPLTDEEIADAHLQAGSVRRLDLR